MSAARAGLEPIDIRVPRVDAYLDRLLEAGAGVRAVVASAA